MAVKCWHKHFLEYLTLEAQAAHFEHFVSKNEVQLVVALNIKYSTYWYRYRVGTSTGTKFSTYSHRYSFTTAVGFVQISATKFNIA